MVLNYDEMEKIEILKFEQKCKLFDKQSGYTMIELKARLKIAAMEVISSGKANNKQLVEIDKIVFENKVEE